MKLAISVFVKKYQSEVKAYCSTVYKSLYRESVNFFLKKRVNNYCAVRHDAVITISQEMQICAHCMKNTFVHA